MTFENAMGVMRSGSVVRRSGWHPDDRVGFYNFREPVTVDNSAMVTRAIIRTSVGMKIHDSANEMAKYCHDFTQDDILAEDWVVA